jgi:diguanylate cyclase (GGDEF)-like protein/PAS domain S-box-containing protein
LPWLIGVSVLLFCIIILLIILYNGIRNEERRLANLVQERTLEINEQRNLLETVTNNYKGVIWSVNKDGVITTFNGRYLEVIGVTPSFLEGKKLELARMKNRHLDIIENVYKTFREGPQDWMCDIDGKTFHSNTVPLYDNKENIIAVVGSTDDVTELIQLQRSLKTALEAAEIASLTDQLTSMPNRRYFNDKLNSEWRRAIREKKPISILIMDIDRFKTHNDTYGHQQGDIILQAVAKIITETIKRPGDFAARWGGEEFVVLLPDTHASGALKVAESMRTNIEKTNIALAGSLTVKITISIGVNTQIPTQNHSIDSFISAADDALYKAKAQGRNMVICNT